MHVGNGSDVAIKVDFDRSLVKMVTNAIVVCDADGSRGVHI